MNDMELDGPDPIAAELGRRGGIKGGKARADNMTPEERTESARNAAKQRWSERTRHRAVNSSAAIPNKTRALAVALHRAGLSSPQVAAYLGMSSTTINSWLKKAPKTFAKAFEAAHACQSLMADMGEEDRQIAIGLLRQICDHYDTPIDAAGRGV